jgi:hypothetical protein
MPSYASDREVINQLGLGGGLNDTGGPLSLNDTESSDLQNVDFDKFKSVLTRNGYLNLTSAAIASNPDIDGLWWYQSQTTSKAIAVAGAAVYKMDDLDGTWDDITGALTITAGNHCSFENFLNTLLVTNNYDPPFIWTGTGDATAMTVPPNLTRAKFVTQYENYCILANVYVDGVAYPSRWYWSTINTIDTWAGADWIASSQNDGQQITGCSRLGDALVIFKERKIFKYIFTGDRDVPFVGIQTASSVGCVAPWSIQEVDNGLVFLSYDGLYFFDGNNSFKLSYRINRTFIGLNRAKFTNAVSCVQKDKNKYMIAVTTSGQAENDKVIVWDYFNNAFSIYAGMAPSAMTTCWVDNIEERPYFGDYTGWVYRMDVGVDDYPLGVQTKISSYYYTNWRHFGDIADQKGVPHTYIYYQYSNSTLTFAYSYDFETNDTYTQTFSLATSGDVYDLGEYGTAVYGGSGGGVTRRDLTGMGRVVRLKFATDTLGEHFQIDGIGNMVNLETFS